MKIATKISMTALATLMTVGLTHYSLAQGPATGVTLTTGNGGASVDVGTAAPAPGPASTVKPASQPAESNSVDKLLVSIKTPTTPASETATETKAADPAPSGMPKSVDVAANTAQGISVETKGKTKDPENEPSDDGVPGSVKKVVDNLNTAADDVTLEDLNAAREAIVKLDVLIDIEKRLNDLSKVRKEREEDQNEEISSALPASALMPVPSMPQYPALQPEMPPQGAAMPGVMPSGTGMVEVMRITGATGLYSAQIREANGTEKRVNVGDKLSDGSKVSSISRSGVTLTLPDQKSKTIQVKDVNRVFSGR